MGLVGPGPCRVRRYLWYQCSDEAPACVETVATEERYCFVYWLYYNTCQYILAKECNAHQVLTITIKASPMQIHRCQMLIECCICITSRITH